MQQQSPALRKGSVVHASGMDRVVITDAQHYNDYVTLLVFETDQKIYPSMLLGPDDFEPPLIREEQAGATDDARQEGQNDYIKRVGLSAVAMIRKGRINGALPDISQHSVNPTTTHELCRSLFGLMQQVGYVHNKTTIANTVIANTIRIMDV